MKIKKIVSYEMDQNCYLLENDGKGVLIDPGPDTEKIIKETEGIEITHILLTHCHFDHTYSLNKIRGQKLVVGSFNCSSNMINPKISLSTPDVIPTAPCDIILNDGEEVNFNGIKIKCIYTPGHTDGSVCFLAEDCLFSGDTLFLRSIGRCDLPTGDFSVILNSVKNKIYTKDGNIKVYPGHGQATTIDFERKNNAFITE